MACRGVLFAITQEQAQSLQEARGDDRRVLSIVQEEIEEAWDKAHLCQTDKAWDAIRRCLGDGTLGCNRAPLPPHQAKTGLGGDPAYMCILCGEQLHKDESYIVSLLTPEQVKSVAQALRDIDREGMKAAYFKIDPGDNWAPGQLSEHDFEYTWTYFEDVRAFYEKAAAEGRWSIFSVDH